MMAPFKDAKNHRPCIENDLELESGRGCENWAEGSKRGGLQTAAEFPGRFQQSTEHSCSLRAARVTLYPYSYSRTDVLVKGTV